MTTDERKWCEEAVAQCERAAQKGVTVYLAFSDPDTPDASDMVVTNAKDPNVIRALASYFDQPAPAE